MSEASADLQRFLAELQTTVAGWDANERHAVIERDPETGLVQVFGVYPDGYAAVVAAGKRKEYHDRVTGPPSLVYEVAMYFEAETEGTN